jgi:hypothetical protein
MKNCLKRIMGHKVHCNKFISIESEIKLKKTITRPTVGQKIGHTIFCKRSTKFTSDLSQTFTILFSYMGFIIGDSAES